MSATKIGRQFVRIPSSTTATAVFLPTANTAGAYLRTVTFVAGNPSSTTSLTLVADLNPPTSITDVSKRAIFNVVVNAGTATAFTLPYELEVPAGWGVWIISDSTSWGADITFDTLT